MTLERDHLDIVFMQAALKEADKGFREGEVPIGAVAVRNGRLVAHGHNRRRGLEDITAHAEIMTLRELSEFIEGLDLSGITIYSTLEPCAMCAGAMIHYGVERIVFGAKDVRAGAAGSAMNYLQESDVTVDGGILADECREILYRFFEKELGKPSKSWEDIELE